jgi:hypothetical protein
MKLAVAGLLAIQLTGGSGAQTTASDPCRRPHCTLAGEDLAYVLALADMRLFPIEKLRFNDGVERNGWDAAEWLWDRHRQGHGGWPEATSPRTLGDIGSVACDPAAVNAIVAAGYASLGRDTALRTYRVASLLDVIGRTHEAEQLLLAAIAPGSEVEDEPAWQDYAHFLARHGRYQEALPLVERDQPAQGGCSLGVQSHLAAKFSWIELCCSGLRDDACRAELFDRRFDVVGINGLAPYVAEHLIRDGSLDPAREAQLWFNESISPRLREPYAKHWRRQFSDELTKWEHAPAEPSYDWANPVDIEQAVERARELAPDDMYAAARLLNRASESGAPAVGHAVLELLALPWPRPDDWSRKYLRECWVDGLLTRTYGCADPDDPATW